MLNLVIEIFFNKLFTKRDKNDDKKDYETENQFAPFLLQELGENYDVT